MAKSKLMKISYRDTKESISLLCYADTLAFTEKGVLAAVRFGGYPEMVRALSDAIFGGGSIEIDDGGQKRMLNTLAKQYKRQLSNDGIYAEATLIAHDDDAAAKIRGDTEDVEPGQQQIELSQRSYYIFCPHDDEDRLFEEIDRKVSTPLIPEFKTYLLNALVTAGILEKLKVWSCSMKFDAWVLYCSQEDRNIAEILEDGLENGLIQIPGAENVDKDAFDSIGGVTQYLKEFGVTMANKIKSRFIPLFDPSKEQLSQEIRAVNANIQTCAGYPLYDAQLACAEALKRKIRQRQPAIIVAECGSGKTKIGAVALCSAHAHEGKRKSFNIVMCPSHVTEKWVREVEETVPNSFGGVIRSISELRLFYAAYQRDDRTAFAVISKEKARDGYMKAPSVFWNKRRKAFLCPHCYDSIEMDLVEDKIKYRVLADATYFMNENSLNHRCERCGEVLWEPLDAKAQMEWVRIGEYGYVHRLFAYEHLSRRRVKKSPGVYQKIREIAANPKGHFTAKAAYRAYPLSTYIKKHMKGKIDGFIADELHQYAQNSGQGDAMAEVAAVADKVIGMTATLINGYSSGIFHLLWRLFSRFMVLDFQKHEDPQRFNKEYGVTEVTYAMEDSEDYNSNRRTSKRKTKERLLPGVSPLVYSRFLLEHAVFLSLMDMGKALPEYEEFPIPLYMDKDVKKEYERIQSSLKEIMRGSPKIANKIMSTAMNLLTVYPDQPYGHKPVMNPLTDEILLEPQDTACFSDLSTKDQKVLDLVKQKIEDGERVLIYTSWVRIDTQQKLLKLLSEAGYRTAVLPNTVSPQKRESWVENKVAEGVQVLITNPSLVETGLDLNFFTTLIYYNLGYNLFTLRQSSRRSWRINQTAPRIEVYFFYYRYTIQESAVNLMASKLAVAGILEGQITDEGLAAMSDCKDLTSQLAKELTKGIRTEVEDIATVFKKMAFLKSEGEKMEFQQSKVMELPVSLAAQQKALRPQKDAWRTSSALVTRSAAPTEKVGAAGTTVQPAVIITDSFVFSAPKRKGKTQSVQVENQLSLFDRSA